MNIDEESLQERFIQVIKINYCLWYYWHGL